MLASRTTFALRRIALGSKAPVRAIATSAVRREAVIDGKKFKTLSEIKSKEDLLPPGANPGTVPTDLDHATGLERLELLGKIEGVEIFDWTPLDASRTGTMENPIVVKAPSEEQYLGCTGSPADSHETVWVTVSRTRPYERCTECGSVYKLEYTGPPVDENAQPYAHEDIKTFADYVKPEYTARYPAGWTGSAQ